MDFELSATTTRLFAGAMGDVEVEVTTCQCRTEDATVSVDCNVIVERLGYRQASSKKYIEPFPASRDPRKSGPRNWMNARLSDPSKIS